MIFKQIESGGDRNYAYLVASVKTIEAILVDPSPDACKVARILYESDVDLKYLINTHSHYDHSCGNNFFKVSKNGNPIKRINCGTDTWVRVPKKIDIGDLAIELIPTPGHTVDSICIKIDSKLLTGDTLFVGKIGGTTNEKEAKLEFESLKKLMKLPSTTEVWPGHNYGVMPSSNIGDEIAKNPFIKRLNDFDEFLWLKTNWVSYKKEHKIK